MNKIISIIILSFSLFSCCYKPFPTEIDARPNVHAAKNIVEESKNSIIKSADEIENRANTISKEAENIRKSIPEDVFPVISENVNEIDISTKYILVETDNLRKIKENLKSAEDELKLAKKNIDNMEAVAASYMKERDDAIKKQEELSSIVNDLKSKERETSRKIFHIITAICVIGSGVGLALLLLGNGKTGWVIGVSSICVMTFSIFVEQFYNYISYAGLAIVLITVASLVYQLIVRERAIEETVHTAEVAKKKLPEEERKRVFGDGEEPGIAYQLQSGSTEKMVDRVRKKYKEKWSRPEKQLH